VNVCDAIVSVALRVWPAGLAAMENETTPLPFPPAPLVRLIQLALLAADHGHPAGDVTSVEAVPPLAAIEALVDETENVHPAPACVTVNAWPAIVNVPVRGDVLPFAVVLKPTLAEPLPVAPPVTVSQDVLSLLAVQLQPAGDVTLAEPVLALAPTA
jgi:hypothetical protein